MNFRATSCWARRSLRVFSPLFLCAVVSSAPAAVSAQEAASPALAITSANRTLSVSATAKAEGEADVADIEIGFTAYGPSLPAVYKSSSDTSNTIVHAVLAAGAAPSDIQSRTQSVYPLQPYDIKAHTGMKYGLQQSWKVSASPKNAALVLDAAIQAGANQSGDISWRMKDALALDQKALARATEQAHAMASTMAQSMEVALGKVLYATNNTSSNVVRVHPMMARSMVAVPAPQPLAIEPQRVESSATVQIVYAIE